MNKEEKRKMKTLELNSKEDFQYYLYQLICRSYKLIRQQDIYLLRLDNYICQKQRENVLMVTKNISVPYDVYKDFLALLGHVETNLLNILGDMQSSSMSYYKFRDIYRKRESRKAVDFQLAPLAACAKMRGVVFGQLLFTADSLANVEAHDTRNWGDGTFAVAMKLAFDAVVEV